MTEREQPPYPAGYRPVPDDDWREHTTPGLTPVPGPGPTSGHGSAGSRPPEYEQPGYGQPAYQQPTYQQPAYQQPGYGRPGSESPGYGERGYGRPDHGRPEYARPGVPADVTAPDYSSRPVALRRPDALAGLVLVLAGIAAGVSLILAWVVGSGDTGWTLVRDGLQDFGGLFGTGLWQPLAIVLGGALLLVVGVLVLVPARAHRTLGLLALLITAAVGAGVLVPIEAAGWRLGTFDVGFFCGIGVAVLGLIGALKALLTGPRLR